MPITPSPELAAMARRLDRDFKDRVSELDADFSVWANSTRVWVDIALGGRLRRKWQTSVRYAWRWHPLAKARAVKTPDQIEDQLRPRIERWIQTAIRRGS